ncbi:uncharacterized protein L201_005196 [Kwoniella dendrophila CBS 6074]|uniref:Protein CPL1-like domain-containing protein n=1 Tax=Kwoniella dendrophila CBS 6074 TaxID=1295534 RepID=A0AAX4JZG6_9TREE
MLSHTLFTLCIITISFLVEYVKADNAFAGCFNTLPSVYTTLTGTYSDATACDLACPNNKHSFYQKSTQTCFCTDKYPSEPSFQYGSADACASDAYYDYRITHTTFIWQPTCYSSVPAGTTFSGLTGPDTCLKNCGTSIGAIFYVSSINGNYQCACNQIPSNTPTTPCGPGTYFYYYHTGTQASQGLSRRRKLDEERKRAIPKYCPKGLTACLIGNDIPGAYECVDTSSELESCGGCLYGTLGGNPSANSTRTIGQDCTTEKGASLGGITCESGKCTAYKCKPNHKLVDGQCIPQKTSIKSGGKSKKAKKNHKVSSIFGSKI